MIKVVTLLAEVHSVAAVAVPVVAYPEYGLECSVVSFSIGNHILSLLRFRLCTLFQLSQRKDG